MKKRFQILFWPVLAVSISMAVFIVTTSIICAKNKPNSGEEISKNTETENYIILVNGERHVISSYSGGFLVLNFLSACDVEIEWENIDCASFELYGKKYFVSIQNKTIIEEGSSFNLLMIPPGTTGGFIYCVNNDILVDFDTMRSILVILNIDASIMDTPGS